MDSTAPEAPIVINATTRSLKEWGEIARLSDSAVRISPHSGHRFAVLVESNG